MDSNLYLLYTLMNRWDCSTEPFVSPTIESVMPREQHLQMRQSICDSIQADILQIFPSKSHKCTCSNPLHIDILSRNTYILYHLWGEAFQ